MPWTVTLTSKNDDAPADSATVDAEADLHHLIRLLVADPRELNIHVRHVSGSEA